MPAKRSTKRNAGSVDMRAARTSVRAASSSRVSLWTRRGCPICGHRWGRSREDGRVTPAFHVPAHPGSTGEAVSRRMSTLKRKDNDAELAVRRLLHAAGYQVPGPLPGPRPVPPDDRHRLHTRQGRCLYRRLLLASVCPEHGTAPASNSAWWATKPAANIGRDAVHDGAIWSVRLERGPRLGARGPEGPWRSAGGSLPRSVRASPANQGGYRAGSTGSVRRRSAV